MENEILFHEEQDYRGTWMYYLVMGISILTIFLFVWALYQQLYLGMPLGENPASDKVLMIISMFAILIMVSIIWLIAYMKLIVKVNRENIYIRYYPFIKKTIPFSIIKSFELRTYRPIIEYGGWGIRVGLFLKGNAYNVKGNVGMQLYFQNRKPLLIGTQNGEEFLNTLNRVLSSHTRESLF